MLIKIRGLVSGCRIAGNVIENNISYEMTLPGERNRKKSFLMLYIILLLNVWTDCSGYIAADRHGLEPYASHSSVMTAASPPKKHIFHARHGASYVHITGGIHGLKSGVDDLFDRGAEDCIPLRVRRWQQSP